MSAPLPAISRIEVPVAPDTVKAIQALMDREGVSLSEAVRRLIGYGEFAWRAQREGAEVLTRRDGNVRKVILLDWGPPDRAGTGAVS